MRYFISIFLIASIMFAVESFYPTEYIEVPLEIASSKNIEFDGHCVGIESGKNFGILYTGVASATFDDFTGFSLRLKGILPDDCHIKAFIYWSHDGNEWIGPLEDWEIEPNDNEGPRDGYLYANPYYTSRPPARYYKASFKLYGTEINTPVIEKVEFVFMNCGWTDYEVKTVAPTDFTDYPIPAYVPRGPEGWNCEIPDGFASGSPTYYSYVTHVTIHHTAGATSAPADPCAQMRNIWHYHVYTRGWSDIGYNFVLDHLGNIYHGRYCEDLTTLNVRPAQVSYHNAYGMGFSVMGNFETDTGFVHPATFPAIYDLIAWKCDQYDINPYGTAINGDPGYEQDAPCILGHKDWTSASTACPGINFHP